MLHIHNLFSVARDISLFSGKEKPIEAKPSVDAFEPPVMLSSDIGTQTLRASSCALHKLKQNVDGTIRLCTGESRSRVLNLSLQLRELSREIESLEAKAALGESLPNTVILSIRRKIWEGEKTLFNAHVETVVESLKMCGPKVRAHLDAIVAIDAIRRNDSETSASTLSAYRNVRPKKQNPSEHDLLYRFDSKLLRELASKDLIIRMDRDFFDGLQEEAAQVPLLKQELLSISSDVRQLRELCQETVDADEQVEISQFLEDALLSKAEIEKKLSELKILEEVTDSAFYLRDHFHVIANKECHKLLERICVVFDEAGIRIATPQFNLPWLIRSLFRGHLELFSGLGILEKLSFKEVKEKERAGEVTFEEFALIGSTYYRISPTGLEKLKEAILRAPRSIKRQIERNPQKQEPQFQGVSLRRRPEIPEKALGSQKKVADYAIGRLDQSVEFK